jgi:glycosyltransferase involved in cell wall biosynthesis
VEVPIVADGELPQTIKCICSRHMTTGSCSVMGSEPIITLAVPYVDGPEYLERTIDSIFAQHDERWTMVFVDNSRDATARQAARVLLDKYDRTRIVHFESELHVGACENFNRCIELSSTDLVSITHSDDELLPNYVGDIIALGMRHPSAMALFAPAEIIGPDSKSMFSLADWVKQFTIPKGSGDLVIANEWGVRSLMYGDYINSATICFRKSKIGALRWDPNLKMSADLDLWTRMLMAGGEIAGTRAPAAYLYRRHPAQATSQMNANLYRFKEESAVYDLVSSRAEALGWKSAARVARKKNIIRLHIGYMLLLDVLNGRWAAGQEKIRVLRSFQSLSRFDSGG